MNEVIDILECSNSDEEEIVKENIESVVILLPKNGEITDEGSDLKNEGNLEHFTSEQLQSEAEIVYRAIKRIKTKKVKQKLERMAPKNGKERKCSKEINKL